MDERSQTYSRLAHIARSPGTAVHTVCNDRIRRGLFASFLNNGVSKITGFFSSAGSNIRDGVGGIFSGGQLRERIDELEEENAALERELAQSRLTSQQLEQLQNLAQILNYDYTDQTFNVVTADVTLEDGSNWNGIFTIDRGSESGIEAGDTVIDGDGLVGFVTDAGEGWAKVMPAISTDETLSFKLARDGSQLGIVVRKFRRNPFRIYAG